MTTPNDIDTQVFNEVRALIHAGRFAEARDALRRHPAGCGRDFRLAALQGDVETVLGNPFAAAASYQRAVAMTGHGALQAVLAKALIGCGRDREALAAIERAADSPDGVAFSPGLVMDAQYLPGVDHAYLSRVHAKLWRSRGCSAAPPPDRPHPARRRLRIGLVSADFRYHPVGNFLVPLFRDHDRARFELIAYDNRGGDGDELTQVLRKWVRFVDIAALSDEDLVGQAARDELDVAIDLSGLTRDNRLNAFARRLAPVQITWAGYVGTTGLPGMDYLLADAVYITPDEERHFSETVLRMPHSYAAYTPYGEVPITGKRRFPADQMVFGCFNNPKKINAELLHLYARILVNTRAVLLFKYFEVGGAAFRNTVAEVFDRYGVTDRVVFDDWSPQRQLLETYNEVDVSLDTMPYNGGYTTCESLYMGVPVLTVRGETFAGRHSASYLTAAGLREFIADGPQAYVDRAIDLAARSRDIEQRQAQRRQFLASPVCDGTGFCRAFERLLEDVVARAHGLNSLA